MKSITRVWSALILLLPYLYQYNTVYCIVQLLLLTTDELVIKKPGLVKHIVVYHC